MDLGVLLIASHSNKQNGPKDDDDFDVIYSMFHVIAIMCGVVWRSVGDVLADNSP